MSPGHLVTWSLVTWSPNHLVTWPGLGNPVGQSGLGLMHLHGKGVPKDYKKALDYFQKVTLPT